MLDDQYLYRLEKGETFHIIDQDGTANELDPGLPPDMLVKMYRMMVQARMFDEKAIKLQRAGRMGTYPPLSGQEAVQVGSAFALDDADWMVPSYREAGAMMARGVPMKLQYMMWMGNDLGNRIPDGVNCLPISIPVGSQMLHATGMAWAANIRKEKNAFLCYFGDGATSRGDFHEALNFAGVFQVPAVFLCSNNGFAISTPVVLQTHAETIAQKAIAYGIRGYRLDGMDVLASYVLAKDALDRAKKGEGPALIEALCYRFGPHTTADNPDLYRDKEMVEKLKRENDPVPRFRNYLARKKLWDDARDKALIEEIDSLVDAAAREAEQAPPPKFEGLVKNVFAQVPAYLEDELNYFKKVSGGGGQ
ncbi:MAG TPA: pyruvate dehydrogenase (acetyl-transferring) E1 component subunit alpha [Methanocella sp.]|uniref:pyruvate dehydrogenase (acetyl-transferring) E1 component subunit alpha n=1 Tax=Methanocella sp. TaxID=2052833 RepID=UPI002B6D607C|nr:pyruvate dehydrogenase (acetyl-transferring) E1 component subunit alpha [Methanocella sp.]HTY91642.1 pyruvate dehydrogenase (acetyl-transferring) E1 component subunit alpha [Methanocella sp.]